jgi:4-amino-4-deoxychorismate lyase
MIDTPVLINGDWSDACSVQDRGLMYGDGVFRTLRMQAGQPVWWDDHYNKLTADCGRLGIPAPAPECWLADLGRLAVVCPDAILRLMVTRGPGERGYRPPGNPRITRIAMAYALPHQAEVLGKDVWGEGVTARLCDLRLGLQPQLAGVKHLNRLENVLARMEWDSPDIQEGVMLDQEGRIVSGTSSNLFILRGRRLLTPDLHRCGVAGVARNRLLTSAAEIGMSAEESDLLIQDLHTADALFFSNSVIKLWWVRRLGERVWSRPPQFDALMECLHD